MKIIAVGDIHHGPNFDQIEAAIAREKPDLTVFLGDYFEKLDDRRDHAKRTATWLKNSLEKHDRIHLWGKHDLPYFFSANAPCPGYTPAKKRAIRSVLGPEYWIRLEVWFLWDCWLFTHAGLSLNHAPASLIDLRSFLRHETAAAWAALFSGKKHWIWGMGKSHGGDEPCGGLLWCDWAHEFTPVPGLNQVVGHTPASTFRTMHGPSSENLCIDVSSMTGIPRILAMDRSSIREVPV